MSKSFWNQRYANNQQVYGIQPNAFFKSFIDSHKPGSILLPAEGEGRNALYAASKGWDVDAFDFSEEAMKRATSLFRENKVNVNYDLQQIENFTAGKKYDAVALIFVHVPSSTRSSFHKEIHNSLVSGGHLIFEAFSKDQVNYNSGGPKDLSLLYDAPSICSDFPFLHISFCGESQVELNEGEFHKGKAAVLQLRGQKL
jgi:SAM-dependent methyltransferase